MFKFTLIVFLLFPGLSTFGQLPDTAKSISLKELLISESHTGLHLEGMPESAEQLIFAGKKCEVIRLDGLNADLSSTNMRQIFAKVPGLSIWENDGSGLQVGIATRGLSPNRSWEFNVRQNGYEIGADIFGYPEAYYAPPMEAVEKIEVVRGAASLQFGPQFGGLLNYRIKKGDTLKPIGFETRQTVGSYGLFNTYNALGGTIKKFSYYTFLHHRSAEGWRSNSVYSSYTGYVSLSYQFSKRLSLNGEYTRMDYKSQQAGGLTDNQFSKNHRESFRSRNWLGAPWNVASFTLKFECSKSISFQIKGFATIAQRNSVGFVKPISIPDTINAATLNYTARQVDRDSYKNYGLEARMTFSYQLFRNQNVLAAGIRLYKGNTTRNQLGTGTTGTDFDLTRTNENYGRSLDFLTKNYAVFAENIFKFGQRLKLVPGIRLEFIENAISGYINTTGNGQLAPQKSTRTLLLYGVGSEFKISEQTNLYGNYSLAYRPVTYSELTPSATTEIIDPNLKDASGFNADIGYRGNIGTMLSFDIGMYYMLYNNRIGAIMQNGTLFRTNIGSSVSKGIEAYWEINLFRLFSKSYKIGSLNLFSSNSFIDARYTKWENPAIINDVEKAIVNKRVENAPKYIHRFGLTYQLRQFSVSCQSSFVGAVFTDASNSIIPNETATIGKLNEYGIVDASFSYKFGQSYSIQAGVNNITNAKYATRRATGYPGPGILPGNGRTCFITFGVKI